MTQEAFKRKLCAILSADVQGYSRLMGDDEDSTVRTLKASRELIGALVLKHRGRVVDSPGDNILVEFGSVVDALRSAVEIQEDLKVRNADLPQNRRMEFRIGINLGDVIQDEDRIYGDGVNVAARVEGLAEGGGICVSGTAFDHVEGKLGLEFEYLGEQSVKNIKKPVRVYRVEMEGSISDIETSQELPLPLHDKPSIAVLPFANISGDPKEDYLSDGITEQIITALSKTPKLFVIARNSVFTYKGKPVKVQQVSKDLGVRYVLEGSVQKSGDRIRITAQLIDAKTGNHLWAEKYDRDLKDIFALQDDIAMNVIIALQLKLTEGEQTRIYRKHTNSIEAYLNLLQAREHMYRHNKQDFLVARRLLKEAIALDPNYTAPYEFLGLIHLMEVMWGWSPSPGESLNQAFELSQKILKIDSSNAPVHGLLSNFYSVKKQHGKAISEAEKFVALDPNNADAYAIMGWALFGAGKFKDSISPFDKAIALNPIPPTWYRNALGWATYFVGLVDDANAVFRKLLIFYPKYGPGYYGLGCTLIAVSKPEEAVVELDKALHNPGWQKSGIIGNRAIALVGIGKPEEAITTMQDLVSRRPDDADGYMYFSFVLRLEGRHEEALQMAKKAVSLRHEPFESVGLGMSYFMLEQYDQAIAEFKKSIKVWADYWRAHVWLVAAYSLTDRMEDARAEIAEVLRINPKTSLEGIAENGFFNYKRADKERFSNALRKAGLK